MTLLYTQYLCHILVVKVYSHSYPTMKPTADKMVGG